MKNCCYILNLAFLLSLMMFTSCKDEPIEFTPVAKFSIIKIENEVVEFRNTSINATEFLWDFGDGNTSTDRDPTHTYLEIGNYTVVLTAMLEGKSNQTSSIVAVSRIFPDELTELPNPPFGSNNDGISFSWNGKGYAGFGLNNFQYSRALWEFNPSNETWKQLANGPKDLVKGCSFVINGKVYMGMGLAPWGDGAKEFFEYDIDSDVYTSVGFIPLSNNTSPNYWSDVTAFSYQEKGYVITSQGNFDSEVVVLEFDPTDWSWEQKTSFPGDATTGMVHFIIDGQLYIGLGDQVAQSGYSTVKGFWEYDIGNDSWTSLSDFPSNGRRDAFGFVYEDKGYVAFGYKNDPLTGGIDAFPEIWEYNVTNNEWTKTESIPISFSHKGYHFMLENKLYFGGGYGNDFSNLADFYKYEF